MEDNTLYKITRTIGYAASVVLFLESLFCLGASVAALIGKAEPFAGILFFPGLILGLFCFLVFKFTRLLKPTHSAWIQLLLLVVSSIITLASLNGLFGAG